MTRKKISNAILEANGGLHSTEALAKAHFVLQNHDLQRPILYHVVVTGGDFATYQAVIKKLMGRIRSKCRAEYFGAYEVADNRDGAHAHLFIVIETRHNQPFKFLDVRPGGYLLKLAKAHKLVKSDGITISPIHVAKPKNAMHRGQMFAVPEGDKLLSDCLKWVSYEFKSRSKEGVQRREVYFNSEFTSNIAKRAVAKAQRTSRKAKPVPVPVPSPAPTGLPVAFPVAFPVYSASKVAPRLPGRFDLGKDSEIKVDRPLLRPLNGRIMVATTDKHERRTT